MSEEGPFVPRESVMGAEYVPWGNVGNCGHARENAS